MFIITIYDKSFWQIFVKYISDGLRKEYGHKGILVQVGIVTNTYSNSCYACGEKHS